MAATKDQTLPGKTARLLGRLPHFYRPEDLGKTFLSLYKTLGTNLEDCERDIFDALKAHHVQTAENAGSKGFIAPAADHGDLDKLFSLFLESLGGTSQLVSMNPLFNARSFDVEKTLSSLYESSDPLLQELNQKLVEGKDQEHDLLLAYLPTTFRFQKEEINRNLILSLLLKKDSFTQYLFSKLADSTKEQLFSYEGKGEINEKLSTLLAQDLNQRVLKDPFLYQKNFDYFERLELGEHILSLRNTLNKKFLKDRLAEQFRIQPEAFDHNKANLQATIQELDFAEHPSSVPMHDMMRLNRMLMDLAGFHQEKYPWVRQKTSIPGIASVRRELKNRFNALLTSDHSHFFQSLLELHIDGRDLQKQYEEDQIMLRRFLLESILPYEITHIYRSYQERLQALIDVLKKGASTRQGIKNIVAANFGMIGDNPEVLKAKRLIQIKEYDPIPTTFVEQEVSFFEAFTLLNPNQDPTTPEVRITMLDSSYQRIRNLSFIEIPSGKSFTVPLELQAGDTFSLKDGDLSYNGVASASQVIGTVHRLPSKKPVDWLIDAEIWSNNTAAFGRYGHFNERAFGEGIFINKEEPIVKIEVLSEKLTYGAFSIIIPWHIPGITDKFEETIDHPRHLIKALVNKVKAAGVRSKVSYLQNFRETHELSDQLNLSVQGKLLNNSLDLADDFSIDSRMDNVEVHELEDGLRTTAVFGYTTFESGNKFG